MKKSWSHFCIKFFMIHCFLLGLLHLWVFWEYISLWETNILLFLSISSFTLITLIMVISFYFILFQSYPCFVFVVSYHFPYICSIMEVGPTEPHREFYSICLCCLIMCQVFQTNSRGRSSALQQHTGLGMLLGSIERRRTTKVATYFQRINTSSVVFMIKFAPI